MHCTGASGRRRRSPRSRTASVAAHSRCRRARRRTGDSCSSIAGIRRLPRSRARGRACVAAKEGRPAGAGRPSASTDRNVHRDFKSKTMVDCFRGFPFHCVDPPTVARQPWTSRRTRGASPAVPGSMPHATFGAGAGRTHHDRSESHLAIFMNFPVRPVRRARMRVMVANVAAATLPGRAFFVVAGRPRPLRWRRSANR